MGRIVLVSRGCCLLVWIKCQLPLAPQAFSPQTRDRGGMQSVNVCGKNKCLSFCFSSRPLSLLILSYFFPFHFHPNSTLSSRRGSPVFSLKLSHLYVSQNEFQCSFFSVLISLFTLNYLFTGFLSEILSTVLEFDSFCFFKCPWFVPAWTPAHSLSLTLLGKEMFKKSSLFNPMQLSPPPGSLLGPLPLLVCNLIVLLPPPTHFIVVMQFIILYIWVCVGWPVSACSWGGSRHFLPSGPVSFSAVGLPLKAHGPPDPSSLFVLRSFIWTFKIPLKGRAFLF